MSAPCVLTGDMQHATHNATHSYMDARIIYISLANPFAVTTLMGGTPGYTDGYAQLIPSPFLFCAGEGAICGKQYAAVI